MNIEIIGSIDTATHYEPAQVAALLEEGHTELNYGESFMGRPGTRLFAGATDILKIRNELETTEKPARRFIGQALAQERTVNIHHPHKTWFLCRMEHDKYKVGNICPRLVPLHKLSEEQPDTQVATKLGYVKQIYRHYFAIAAAHGLRLDEGLSNFGVGDAGRLYYLDDDIYNWDNFHSFAHLLGVLIRNNAWLDEQCAEELGEEIRNLIGEHFKDSHHCMMVANKLKDVFVPDPVRKNSLDVIIRQLQQNRAVNKQMVVKHDHLKHDNVKHDYVAVLADVHANLPALEVCLDFLKKEGIRHGMVLGDVVGYGPHPGACIDRLRDSGYTVIKGNHDHAAVTGDLRRGMSSMARHCIEWTITQLSSEQKQWLDELPMELSSSEEFANLWVAMHGSPVDPNFFYAYVYEMTYKNNLDNMAKRQVRHCFHGHTHVQGIYARKKPAIDEFFPPQDGALAAYVHTLVCPGSIGQPRNGKAGVQFAVYNQKTDEIKFLNLDYPVDKTIADLQKEGFPDSLGERLRSGH